VGSNCGLANGYRSLANDYPAIANGYRSLSKVSLSLSNGISTPSDAGCVFSAGLQSIKIECAALRLIAETCQLATEEICTFYIILQLPL
jgi:hypothetical protein